MEIIISLMLISGIYLYYVFKRSKNRVINQRVKIIKSYTFPKKIKEMVLKIYPHLSQNDVKLVLSALKEYFIVCAIANGKIVSMPSQVADVAWHEFILFTKEYESFCKRAFGKFLHHNPAEAMKSKTDAQKGIKLAWKIACQREKIDPQNPSKIPLLFAIDTKLNISDGFKYSLNCKNNVGDTSYCVSDIGCSSHSVPSKTDISCSSDTGCTGGCSSE